MSLSIQTNSANLVGQNTINKTQGALMQSMERLSTGFRINSASDDAAGLQISNRLEAQTRGMNVAMRNAGDASSQMQTAEGAMDEMTNIAYRMNDLATQANNGTASAEDRTAMQAEFTSLNEELVSISENTSFGGQKLLGATGAFGAAAVTYQVGASSAELLTVKVDAEVKAIATAIGAAGAKGLGDISTAGGAKTAMDLLSAGGGGSFIDQIGAARSALGANINRLDHTVANLGNMIENSSAAKSRIMDTDMAAESSSMSKNQMLMQSGAQILQQTKMVPQLAMSLL
ncbi:flagellin N-terminal helical domain-containing protein [Psychromonas sp. Urea-02u-13]|uniref:flagellin N-terminal helical domain-containing protein n=1 Tax=Psychromonas sp. Urea-02u-13 TaxID=2058326 RepID=UPI000C349477|nr:flagellin [Psychromonas sp. Urea-02u-13]PKG40851.1 Lateral flagellin [Psychromonas sp. Urea-02u-13]